MARKLTFLIITSVVVAFIFGFCDLLTYKYATYLEAFKLPGYFYIHVWSLAGYFLIYKLTRSYAGATFLFAIFGSALCYFFTYLVSFFMLAAYIGA